MDGRNSRPLARPNNDTIRAVLRTAQAERTVKDRQETIDEIKQ